jgi:molybdopterin-guanine dinucleotide biosynthesis protein A
MPYDLDCAIIAGGRSTRLGGPDKALVPIDGVPMLRLIVDQLSSVARNMVVNCRAEQRASFATALDGYDVEFALDDSPNAGPIAGLATALERTAEPTFVLGCDYQLVESTVGCTLRQRLADVDCTTAAVVPRVDGHPQPL